MDGETACRAARALQAFNAGELDLDALRRLEAPVYFALGGLSNPDHYAKIAERLSGVFPDFTLEVFEQRHHFEPPHRVEPERLASSLPVLWARAETVSVARQLLLRATSSSVVLGARLPPPGQA